MTRPARTLTPFQPADFEAGERLYEHYRGSSSRRGAMWPAWNGLSEAARSEWTYRARDGRDTSAVPAAPVETTR